MEKIYDVLNHDELIDMPIDYGEDADGSEDFYVIFETHEDMAKFIHVASEVAGKELDGDYEVEKEFGAQLVFYDEYSSCSDCQKIIRTSPTSWHWQPDFFVGDGYIVCSKCFTENEDYQEAYLEEIVNNYQKANQLLDDEQLQELGFKQISEHEYFMGERTTDTPERLYYDLKDSYDDIVFNIDSSGQFHTEYSVWVRGEVDHGEVENYG